MIHYPLFTIHYSLFSHGPHPKSQGQVEVDKMKRLTEGDSHVLLTGPVG